MDAVIPGRDLGNQAASAIWRVIVYDYHLVLLSQSSDVGQQTRNVLGFVIGSGDDDALHSVKPQRGGVLTLYRRSRCLSSARISRNLIVLLLEGQPGEDRKKFLGQKRARGEGNRT